MTISKSTSVTCTFNFNASLAFSEQVAELEAQVTSQVGAYLAAQETTAAVASALDASLTALGVQEINVKGALAYMTATGIKEITEDSIKSCCEANPETFKYLPAHGLRKAALVSRVMAKTEKSASDDSVGAEKVEEVVKAIVEEPNKGATYYKAKFDLNKGQWQKVIDLAMKTGAIGKSGERSNTVYFPKAA